MKIKVFGDTIKVLKVKNAKEFAGLYDTEKKTILISDEFVGQVFNETLIHEICEAVYFRCSFYQSLPHELKEVLFDCIAKAVSENFSLVQRKKSK